MNVSSNLSSLLELDLTFPAVSKHGTCFSTFDTKCYSPYTEHEDVVNFFDTVTKAYLKVMRFILRFWRTIDNFSSTPPINGSPTRISLLQTLRRTRSLQFRALSNRLAAPPLILAVRAGLCPRFGTLTMSQELFKISNLLLWIRRPRRRVPRAVFTTTREQMVRSSRDYVRGDTQTLIRQC